MINICIHYRCMCIYIYIYICLKSKPNFIIFTRFGRFTPFTRLYIYICMTEAGPHGRTGGAVVNEGVLHRVVLRLHQQNR